MQRFLIIVLACGPAVRRFRSCAASVPEVGPGTKIPDQGMQIARRPGLPDLGRPVSRLGGVQFATVRRLSHPGYRETGPTGYRVIV